LLSKGLFSKALRVWRADLLFDSGGENHYYAAFVSHLDPTRLQASFTADQLEVSSRSEPAPDA
jgi:hypothetical protein